LFLHEKKLLARPIFYMSAYLEEHRNEYIARLRALGTKADAWNQWIAFFLQALDEQARANTEKARAIIDLYEKLKARVLDLTHSQFAVPILDQIFERPLFQSSDVKFTDGRRPTKQAIGGLLRILRENGILEVVRAGRGRRAQVLAFTELIRLCEARMGGEGSPVGRRKTR
jgi:hypothetical protein